MESTTPLTLGFHEVMVNGAVALKLKALLRVKVSLPSWTVEKLPTAYMTPPHWTSCLICSVCGVPSGKCGVPVAGCTPTVAGVAVPPWLIAACPAGPGSARASGAITPIPPAMATDERRRFMR